MMFQDEEENKDLVVNYKEIDDSVTEKRNPP